jgi:hypothetical protein
MFNLDLLLEYMWGSKIASILKGENGLTLRRHVLRFAHPVCGMDRTRQ